MITKPKFSKLFVGKRSDLLSFNALPDSELKITPLASDKSAIFEPPFVRIAYPQTEAGFYVTTRKVGFLKIRYKITGPNAANFLALPSQNIYSSFKYTGKLTSVGRGFYRTVCQHAMGISCPNKKRMFLTSSCLSKSNAVGFVSVFKEDKDIKGNSRNLMLPLSVVGMLPSTYTAIDNDDIIDAKTEVEKYLRHGKFAQCKREKSCSKIEVDSDLINTMNDNHLFTRGYFNELAHLMPFWLRLGLDSEQVSFSSGNLKSAFLRGSQMPLKKACMGMIHNDDDLYTVHTPRLKAIFNLMSVSKTTDENARVCYSVNVCDNFVQIGQSKETLFSMTDVFQSYGVDGLDVNVRRFGVGGNMAKVCSRFGKSDVCFLPNSYWDASGTWNFREISSQIIFEGIFFAADIDQVLIY